MRLIPLNKMTVYQLKNQIYHSILDLERQNAAQKT